MNNVVGIAGQQFTAAKGGRAAAATRPVVATAPACIAASPAPWRLRHGESAPAVDHELPPRPVLEYTRG